jgi:hypothetical protein
MQSGSKDQGASKIDQFPRSLSLPSRQTPVLRSRITEDQLADHYRYVTYDLKRWIVIAPAMFLLVIVLYFIFG